MKESRKTTPDDAGVRLDKWLWAARFYKTRAVAREMIDGGKVHYNGVRGKPSRNVEVGAEIRLRQGNDDRTIIVLALSTQRGGAEQAQRLYQETAQSIAKREALAQARKLNALSMPHPDRRPDKKERRNLLKFKHGQSE
ncbi:ribosome-associated heat shock protein Hsp15 [Edwardsiella tarda]|uniref:Heat shock protein 15 n=2 Tax=Edwardsiella tarda TaxID=636 RepID=A0A2A7TZ82_EDWTA|nr:ribosome-associated heat shock protein Hsp15 [Edwardsiella tarda]AKH87815.1 ribosome-associated heat shock protein Hsp15 [Edwardsiella tarda]PEH71389.1 heat-shock protein [Edwardsiella tarda]UAL56486.1 ribosome-associated heat shock protein Hsp15 [Edwardsiella tarda]UCQ00461.1 ribosome-associated heat shock protein Hsp15 [Edwardsiella tarda ATCC 15947 = NBRC 105688]UCQ11561.1 ribosome-associated heat shock protein Hsp15 [Edwardsiella tarda]